MLSAFKVVIVVFEFFLKIWNVFDRKPFTLWNLTDRTWEFYLYISSFLPTLVTSLKMTNLCFGAFSTVLLSILDKHFFSFLIFRTLPSLPVVLNCTIRDFLVIVFCLSSFFVNTFLMFIYKIFRWLDNFLHIKFLFSVNRNTIFHQFLWLSFVINFKSRSPTKLFMFIII